MEKGDLYIDKDAKRAIVSTISRYPRLCALLEQEERNVVSGSSGGDRPTESKVVVLSSGRFLSESRRKCKAVSECLSRLPDEHRKVVCLRFWGTCTEGNAINLAKSGKLRGKMKFESSLTASTVTTISNYSDVQSRRICREFIIAVGILLGEI